MRREHVFALLFMLLALPCAYPAPCPAAVRHIYLAAVTGENSGGIFQLEVETRPGNGSVFTSVYPRMGISAQESEEGAVERAFSGTPYSKGECDVLFKMKGDFGDTQVDGPSAGGAMAVAVKAALLNKSIRQDIVMTGTVTSGETVGEVGGVIEKAIAAADAGAKYFLAPKIKVYEALLLSRVSEQSEDFTAIDVSNLSYAERIVYSDYSENFSSAISPESSPIPNGLRPIAVDEDLGRFTIVAEKVVGTLDQKVSSAFIGAGQFPEISGLENYFKDEVGKYRRLLAMGYPFTAANSAFLLSIDAEYARVGGRKVDLNGSFEDVTTCISSANPPKKTAENFQWAIGSDLRRTWARTKLNDTQLARSEQAGYTTLRDLLFAYSWCGISRELGAQADDIGGHAVNEALLSGLASKKLIEAQAAFENGRTDYDALWHLRAAFEANDSGDFGAAIYDATYAKTMEEIASEGDANISGKAIALASQNRSSVWGKIYQGQGQFIFAEANANGASYYDAYRILRYAQELDAISSEIDGELLKSGSDNQPAAAQGAQSAFISPETDNALIALLTATVAVLDIVVISRLLRRVRGRA